MSTNSIVTLELSELDRYHDRAERALTETIAAYGNLDNNVDTKRWKSIRSRHGVQLFRGRQLDCEEQTPMLCVGTLHGRFDDVLEGLYCDTSENMLLMNTMKCPRVTESAVLYAVKQQKKVFEPYSFTGIKWATIKLSVANNRDLCYFDKMGMVRQASGKRMAYHVIQSVDVPEYPHRKTHKRVRASLCYLFEELEDDLVGVYMQGEMDHLATSCYATIAVSNVLLELVANALDCSRAKKLALMMMSVSRKNNAPRKKNCCICKGGSSFFESLANCAGCNEYVCKKCRSKERVLALDTTSGSYLKRAEFCSVCVSKMNVSSVDQIRVEARGFSVQTATFCTIEDENEDVTEDFQDSRCLESFMRNISMQMHELNAGGDIRASSLSSMGKTSMFDDDLNLEEQDVLLASRLKSNSFVTIDKIQADKTRRRNSTATTSSSCYSTDDGEIEVYLSSLFAKLQQVSNQAEKTLYYAREQSLVARSVRDRSRRGTQSSEG